MEPSTKVSWNLKNPSDLLSNDESSNGWLVEGWIPRKRIVLIAGDSGLGKSPLVYQLGLAVASGSSVLGRTVEAGRVLYLDGENGLGEMASTTSSLIKHLSIEDSSNFFMLSLSDVGPSWSRPNNLSSLVKSVQPSLVVIDTISSFWPGIEEKNALTSSKYAEIRSIISSTSCSFVLIHHLSKTPADGRLGLEDSPNPRKWFESVRGASALVNNADIRIGIDSPSTSGIRSKNVELIVGGFGRVRGTIPLTFLTRVRDEFGDPLGYSVVSNLDLFDPDVRAYYDKLPDVFTWKDARLLTINANNWIVGSLGKLKSADLIRQPVARGSYYKV